MRKINPREIIGTKHRCDTKEGKKCMPMAMPSWYTGTEVKCKHCQKFMKKPRS